MIYAHYHNLRKKVPTKPFFANFLCEKKKLIEKKSLQFFYFYGKNMGKNFTHVDTHRPQVSVIDFFYELPVLNVQNNPHGCLLSLVKSYDQMLHYFFSPLSYKR